ncbi:MAG: hypothetical protein ACX939_12260, partial [Hyphococcus sp.]
MLEWIFNPSNHQTITAWTSLIIALAGIASFFSTIWIIRQNRKLLRETNAPYVVGYLFLDQHQPQLMNIYFENVGKEPAFNLRYRIKGNIPDSDKFWPFFKDKLEGDMYVLPPGQKISLGVGVTHNVLAEHSQLFLNLGVYYDDRYGLAYNEEFSANPGQFNLLSSPESPSEKIWRELEKIKKSLGVFSKDGFGRLLVRTQTESEASEKWEA